MNIIFISLHSINNFKEQGIYTDLIRTMKAKGHSMYVVSPAERRHNKNTSLIDKDGINLLTVNIGNITKTNLIEKGISTLTIGQLYKRAVKKHFNDVKFDLVIYTTPPITFLDVITYLKKRDNAKTYLLLKDIFPQNAIDLKLFRENGMIHKFFSRTERNLYSISDYIGTMSQANSEYIIKHYPELDDSKVEVCPNTISPVKIDITNEERKAIKEKYNIPIDKVIYLYGGNLGKPQGIDFLIKCIKKNEENSETFILIVGSGTEFEKLNEFFEKIQPKNSKLMNSLPKKDYEKLANSADVGLIFLDHRFTIPNFPSRLLSYMQASIPVIAATDKNTDIGNIITENRFGYWNESIDVDAFNNNLIKLTNKETREQFGKNAHNYLYENYTTSNAYQTIMKHMERGM